MALDAVRSRSPPCRRGLVARAHRRGVRRLRGRGGALDAPRRRGVSRRRGRAPLAAPPASRDAAPAARGEPAPRRSRAPASWCRAASRPSRRALVGALDGGRHAARSTPTARRWRRPDRRSARALLRLARDRRAAAAGDAAARARSSGIPSTPERVGALRSALKRGRRRRRRCACTRDLERRRARTRARFLAAVVDPAALPPPAAEHRPERLHLPASRRAA